MIAEQYVSISAPFGSVRVTLVENYVSRIESLPYFPSDLDVKQPSELAQQVEKQFHAYFDSGSPFTFPYILTGSDFQQKVWQFLQTIPRGETRTYGNIADSLHTSARAVGGACRHNPLPILIPCHRVISSSGQGGYCGETEGPQIRIKSWLLAHENH